MFFERKCRVASCFSLHGVAIQKTNKKKTEKVCYLNCTLFRRGYIAGEEPYIFNS